MRSDGTGDALAAGTNISNAPRAPEFSGLEDWLNTPPGKPLSIAGLRGKVVIVDFWTYSCINCLRTLPHLKACIAVLVDGRSQRLVAVSGLPRLYTLAQSRRLKRGLLELRFSPGIEGYAFTFG